MNKALNRSALMVYIVNQNSQSLAVRYQSNTFVYSCYQNISVIKRFAKHLEFIQRYPHIDYYRPIN